MSAQQTKSPPAAHAVAGGAKTRSALRTPTWWIQEPGAAVPPGDVTIDALPSTTVRVPRRFRWTRGVLRRTDESYEGAVSPPRRLFVGAAEKRRKRVSAHLMHPGGPCTQSDEDLMTIGSCRSSRPAPAAPSRLFRGAAASHQDFKSPARRCRRETPKA